MLVNLSRNCEDDLQMWSLSEWEDPVKSAVPSCELYGNAVLVNQSLRVLKTLL